MLESFRGCSIRDLDELRVDGESAVNDSVLQGRVIVVNESGKKANLNALLSNKEGMPTSGDKLALKNVEVRISDMGAFKIEPLR